jgi:hypothetical protein
MSYISKLRVLKISYPIQFGDKKERKSQKGISPSQHALW